MLFWFFSCDHEDCYFHIITIIAAGGIGSESFISVISLLCSDVVFSIIESAKYTFSIILYSKMIYFSPDVDTLLQYSTVQYTTIQYSTLQYRTVKQHGVRKYLVCQRVPGKQRKPLSDS